MYDAGQYLLCVANKQILDCVEVTGNIVGETMTNNILLLCSVEWVDFPCPPLYDKLLYFICRFFFFFTFCHYDIFLVCLYLLQYLFFSLFHSALFFLLMWADLHFVQGRMRWFGKLLWYIIINFSYFPACKNMWKAATTLSGFAIISLLLLHCPIPSMSVHDSVFRSSSLGSIKLRHTALDLHRKAAKTLF